MGLNTELLEETQARNANITSETLLVCKYQAP